MLHDFSKFDLWVEILFFVITDNKNRHPWFWTSNLGIFCHEAAKAIQYVNQRFEILHERANDIAKKQIDVGNFKKA